MANSLSEECTPFKHEYDSCFNAWFEGYLEPAVTTSSQTRSDYTKRKADEFDAKCGSVWEKYKACVQVCSVIFSPNLYQLLSNETLVHFTESSEGEGTECIASTGQRRTSVD